MKQRMLRLRSGEIINPAQITSMGPSINKGEYFLILSCGNGHEIGKEEYEALMEYMAVWHL